MIWSKEEIMPREELEALQLERLKETVARVYEKVPAYRQKMIDAGVTPDCVQTLSDLSKLPFVTKADMRDNYPFGLFAVEKERNVQAVLGQSHSGGHRQRDTLVGGAVQHRRLIAHFLKIRFGIELAQAGDVATGFDHASVDEIRNLTAGFGGKITEF